MNPPTPDPRPLDPKTRVIEAYISASVEEVLRDSAEGPQDGLLFLSSWHEAMPAMVFLDPVLEANDKVLFAVLWIWGRQHGRSSMAFPNYAYLMERCRIRSRSTLARCLAVLRICRWITLCRRVRDSQGRNRGNIYALHEEPLSLSDTVHLDPEYMGFLRDAAAHHHHEQVRRIARGVLDSIQEQVDEGQNPLDDAALSQTERRLSAVSHITSSPVQQALNPSSGYFAFRSSALRMLNQKSQSEIRDTSTKKHGVRLSNSVLKDHRVRLSNCQKSNSVLCSSSYIYKKTTTTNTDSELEKHGESPTGTTSLELAYPEFLSPNEQALAEMYLTKVPEDVRQPLLDELIGQVRSRKATSKPIRNAIGFLAWLCNEAAQGNTHLTSAGVQTRELRERQARIARHEAEKIRSLTAQTKAGPGIET